MPVLASMKTKNTITTILSPSIEKDSIILYSRPGEIKNRISNLFLALKSRKIGVLPHNLKTFFGHWVMPLRVKFRGLNLRFNYTTFLFLAPIMLFFAFTTGIILYLGFFIEKKGEVISGAIAPTYNVYTSKPKNVNTYEVEATLKDARPDKVKAFFEIYDAPLAGYADFIVEMADKYGIDWRLISAIGFCEGNGGKRIPENSHNTWGWAASEYDLANGTGRYNLGSWENAIEIVSKGLKTHYIDQGLNTPEEIMVKYAPPSVAKGGPWAKCVNLYMNKIEDVRL